MIFLESGKKSECFGCEACAQICTRCAISMIEDEEGFRYPQIDATKCVSCGECYNVCPYGQVPLQKHAWETIFGGYHTDPKVRQASTSGGAFAAIVDSWCTGKYAVFGASAVGLEVHHTYIIEKGELSRLQKSKYSQSIIGRSYADAKTFLAEGKKVLFCGTPCQIAGLESYLTGIDKTNLLTVEMVCEGVPSPLFIRKLDDYMKLRYGSRIRTLDYRNKDKPKWDFLVMKITLENGRTMYVDGCFNPFFILWFKKLMSRPSCYGCPFTAQTGIADITLADLWGVQTRNPELYGQDKGTSLVFCNTEKGAQTFALAQNMLYGHRLNPRTILEYQTRLREPVKPEPQRENFMKDLRCLSYRELCKKWVEPPSLRLLWSKYVWGNRQKVFVWSIMHRRQKRGR